MERVVGYDYHIDNNEEMKMVNFRIEDVHSDQAEVDLLTHDNEALVSLDFDPECNGESPSLMHYTPEAARKLAAALIAAADNAEKHSDTEGK